MKLIIFILISYIIGSVNPAALIGKLKRTDLKRCGTGNLGATNAAIIFGKAYGALVMLFDISKAFVCVKLAEGFCPEWEAAKILCGSAAVLGHIFPFYLKFRGGKGLAPYAGMILGLDPILFLILLFICAAFMIIGNYGVFMPWSAGILFPSLCIFRSDSIVYIMTAFAISALVMIKHFPNLKKALRGEDIKVREVIKKSFTK